MAEVASDGHKGGGDFDLLILVAHATPAEYLAYLRREHICYLVAGRERIDLNAALSRMATRLGVSSVVSKAGGGLNAALLRAGLVDDLHITLIAALVGGLGTPSTFDGPPLAIRDTTIPLRLISVQTHTDGTVWLHSWSILTAADRSQPATSRVDGGHRRVPGT